MNQSDEVENLYDQSSKHVYNVSKSCESEQYRYDSSGLRGSGGGFGVSGEYHLSGF